MSEPPNKDKHLKHERQDHGWFASKPHSYADLIKHPLVEPWIKRYSEGESQESYARALQRILETTGKDVEGILALPSDEAKKVVLSVADALKKEGSHAMGKKIVITAKGFFEVNKKPFELDRQEKRKYYVTMRKKVAYEVIPKKEQVYKMADASLTLKAGFRNRAVILCLFQSGVRENALCRWTYGMFKDKLYPEVVVPVKLVITAEMDTKLQLYDLGYYITFLQREAAEALKAYLNYRMQRGWHPKDKDPVFVTESTASRDRPLKPANIWEVIKQPQVVGAAGIDSHSMWVRLLRKSFQKILNQSDIDEDTKEAIMGHKVPGSRGNYFDSHDHDEIASKYTRCQFDRTALSGQDTLTSGLAKLTATGWKADALSEEERSAVSQFLREKMKPPKELERIADMTFSAHDMKRYIELLNPARMQVDEVRKRPTRRTAHNGGTPVDCPYETCIVDEEELLPLLNQGWDVVRELASGKVIVRRPNGVDE
jgi:integrase